MLGRLPIEIIRLILNGGPSVDLRTMRPPHAWEKRPGAHLDMRWRFAARAVCHLWRAIIEHPTQSEARTIGWRKAVHATNNETRANKCPKWTTGRMVCASVIADWLKWTVSAWTPRTADQIYEWCRHMVPNVSRKQVIVALVASMVPGAIQHAIHTEWERVMFTAGDTWRMYGEYTHWNDDARGDLEGICEVLATVIGERAQTLTPFRLLAQRCGDHISVSCLLGEACRRGNGTLVRLLLSEDRNLPVNNSHWVSAARAPNPSALDCLLCMYRNSPRTMASLAAAITAIDPRSATYCDTWFGGALAEGRWETLATCDRHGIAFDDSAAIACAASWRRVRLMAWLWDRAERRGRRCDIDLFEAAVQATGVAPRHVRRPHKSIEWLCSVAQYVPHASAPERTIGALVGALESICAQSLVHGLSRWPRLMCTGLDAQALERAFRACARESLEMAHAFLTVLDCYGGKHGLVPGPDGFDGWALLTKPHPMPYHGLYGGGARDALGLGRMLAFMRTARRAAKGHRPLRKDVRKLVCDRDDVYDVVCPCSTHPMWSHNEQPYCEPSPAASVYENAGDGRAPFLCVSARKAGRRVHKRIEACACPPTDAVKQLTYLMGKWCAPYPVRVDLVFPGWVRNPHKEDSGDAVWFSYREDDRILEIVVWLERVGLLHSDTSFVP